MLSYTYKDMLKFFFKAFLLSFIAILVSWLFNGAFYSYRYSKAQGEILHSEYILPRPAIVNTLLKDTNFLLLGMAGSPYPAPYLTDTIMVGMFRVDPMRLTLVSIPRDLWVQVPGGKQFAKINSLYELGKTYSAAKPEVLIRQKVEEITGLSIDYHAIIDVQGLEKLIDFLGGVDIDVKKPIADPFFPGPNYSYDPLYLKAGMQHLNGHDAVRFARSRHTTRGDFDRMERQQQLLAVLKEKIATYPLSAQDALAFLQDVRSHLTTDIELGDIPFLIAAALEFGRDGQIQSFSLDTSAQGLLASTHAQTGAYTMVPRAGLQDYSQIQAFILSLQQSP